MSGYERKKIDNALQTVTLGEKDSDCGTNFGLKIIIPKKMKNQFLDRYILSQDGSLVLLTAENIDEYIEKEVTIRSPLYCKSDCICNKCAGEFFYKMNIQNAGLITNTMAGVLMNASMKKFHDASVKFSRIEIANYIKKR